MRDRRFASLRRASTRLGALLFAGATGGCILTTDIPDPALDIPRAYQAAGGKRTDAPPKLDWWRGFGSRELTALMEEAQTVNLDIAAAAERIAQADAQARITGAALPPSLSALASATQLKSSSATSTAVGSTVGGTVVGSTGGREIRTFSTSLSASYEFDFWGKNRAAALNAEETSNAVRFDREVVALTTMAAVANAYFQVLASQDRLKTAGNNIASAQRILDAIKSRLTAGTGNDLEVAQQESVLANQRASVPPLRQTLATNMNALALLVARPPESLAVAGGSLNRIAAPRVTPGLPSELLTQRPDIRRQEAYLASATANIGNARAQFFPSIVLTGNSGYQSAALATLFTPQAVFYNVATSLTQPIFDGGRIQGNFDLSRARQDELLQTYRKTVVSAFTDVDNALVAIRETTERLRLQREVVAASQRAFGLAEQQLRAGTADIVTVLNTQLTLFQAQDLLSQVQLSRLLAIVSLYQALGGGWEPRVERSVNALKPDGTEIPKDAAPSPVARVAGGARRRTVSIFVTLLILGGLGYIGWMAMQPKPAAAPFGRGAGRPDAAVPVLAATARTQDVPVYLDGVGSVKALNTVTVRAQVDGKLLSINFKEGQDVKAGDVLAEIDPVLYKALFDQAVAKKAQDEATLANARLDLTRYQQLAATNAGSKQQADTQKATVAQLEAQVRSDQAAIDNAAATLSYTKVIAPLTGRAGLRQVDQGNIIRASDANGIVVITQLQPIAVQFSLPQQQIVRVNAAAAKGELAVDVFGNDGVTVVDTGTLAGIDNQVDITTGTVKLKAVFQNSKFQLWPGQFVNVRLKVETLPQAIVIPTSAVQRGPAGSFSYVVGEGDIVSARPVTVTQQNENDAVIAKGIAATDRVVTTGFANLADGAKVSIGANDATPTPDLAPRKRQGKGGEGKGGEGGDRRGKKSGGDPAAPSGEQKGQASPAPGAPAATKSSP